MTRVVHAEQENGRSLDADLIRLSAFLEPKRPVPGEAARIAPGEDRWQVERFEAEGDVIVLYPGVTEDGDSFVACAPRPTAWSTS